jgi:nucleotide-binding universal stress UspA family protein
VVSFSGLTKRFFLDLISQQKLRDVTDPLQAKGTLSMKELADSVHVVTQVDLSIEEDLY